MSDRRLAVLVAVAAVAGLGIAIAGLATRGKAHQTPTLQIDEVNGRVGSVVLGETPGNVESVLGRPTFASATFVRYPHVVFEVRGGEVASITTNDPGARTDKAVRIGDPLSAARASYRKAAKCNPDSPDKQAAHPVCVVTVAGTRMWIYGDPIREIRLAGTG